MFFQEYLNTNLQQCSASPLSLPLPDVLYLLYLLLLFLLLLLPFLLLSFFPFLLLSIGISLHYHDSVFLSHILCWDGLIMQQLLCLQTQ